MGFWKRWALLLRRWRTPRTGPRPTPVAHVEVVLYTRSDCPLCDKAWPVLQRLRRHWHYTLLKVAIDSDTALTAAHGTRVPVVTVQGKVRFWGAVNPVLLERLLAAEARRAANHPPPKPGR